MKNTKRIEFLDIIKGIAIFLVIVGHSIQFGSGTYWMTQDVFYNNFLFKFIYSFHMPLFMLISGYLFFYSINKYSFLQNLAKRMTSLLIPIISWTIVYNIIDIFVTSRTFVPIPFIKQCILYALDNFWFLWGLFYCSLAVLLVKYFFADRSVIYICGFILTFIIPDHYNLHLYKFVYPFFIIGYIINKRGVSLQKGILKPRRLIVASLLFCSLLTLYTKEVYIYVSHYYLFGNIQPIKMLIIDLFRLLIGLLGCILVIHWLNIFYNKVPQVFIKICTFIGQNSLGIYIISGYVFPFILAPLCANLTRVNYIILIFESILITSFSLLFALIIKKINLCNFLLLGGRK